MSPSALTGLSATLPAGPEATLINLSQGGVLLQVESRLAPRLAVRVRLVPAAGEPTTVDGHVAWVRVAAVADGKVLYHAGVGFDSAVLPLHLLVPRDETSLPATTARAVLRMPPARETSAAASAVAAERETLRAALDAAIARGNTLQARLDLVTQEQQTARLAERREFERVIAELVSASHDQQLEYQLLQDAERARDAELDFLQRETTAWENQVTDYCRAIEARLAGTEERRAAFEEWCRKLFCESEQLLEMVRSMVRERPSRVHRDEGSPQTALTA